MASPTQKKAERERMIAELETSIKRGVEAFEECYSLGCSDRDNAGEYLEEAESISRRNATKRAHLAWLLRKSSKR
jgi:hypothetical protein